MLEPFIELLFRVVIALTAGWCLVLVARDLIDANCNCDPLDYRKTKDENDPQN